MILTWTPRCDKTVIKKIAGKDRKISILTPNNCFKIWKLRSLAREQGQPGPTDDFVVIWVIIYLLFDTVKPMATGHCRLDIPNSS